VSNLSGVAGAAVPMAAAATFLRGLREALERLFDLTKACTRHQRSYSSSHNGGAAAFHCSTNPRAYSA